MDRSRRCFGAAIAALALLAGVAGRSHACSCTNNLTLMEEFDHSAVVFSGRVIQILPSFLPDENLVMLEPIERWKGGLAGTVQLFTPANEAICGYSFQLGQEYLVFASLTVRWLVTPNEYAFTHLCSRTSALAGNPFVALLPPPVLPVPARVTGWGALKSIYR